MKNSKLKSTVFVFIVVVLLFVISSLIILIIKSNTSNNEHGRSLISFVGDSRSVTIKSFVAVSDKFGKSIDDDHSEAFGYLEFDIVNNTSQKQNYQIYITPKVSNTRELNSNYLIFYLTDDNNRPYKGFDEETLPSLNSLYTVKDKPESSNLYRGSLNGNERAHFILRVWLAENYVILNEKAEFSFDVGTRSV